MRKQRTLEFIACFMIALVVTIPFYIGTVFAAPSISAVTASGGDGFQGVMKPNDVIDVKASIEDGSEVTNDRVLLGAEPFDNCDTQFTTICSKLYSPPGGFSAKILPFNVRLLDENLQPTQDFGGSIAVDGNPPQISLQSVSPSHSSGQEDISFTYTATDTACTGEGCEGKCAGIASIEFFTADNTFREVVEENSPSCTLSGTLVVDASKFSNGDNRLLARATDRFEQVGGEDFIDFTVDLSGPSIDPGSFTILRNGDLITHFIPFTDYGVVVEVSVNEQDVDLNNVFADLSSLNPGASLNNVKGVCQARPGGADCAWNILLNLPQSGVKEVEIKAADTTGNVATSTFSKNFIVDSVPPQVNDILVPGVPNHFKYLVRPTTDIQVLISDSGSGLREESIFLQVGNQKIQAASCDSSSCLWKDVNLGVTSGKITISIHPDSSDAAGNKVNEFSQEFMLNTNLPGFETIHVQGIGGLSGVVEDFISVGDRMAVTANVTHENGIASTFADFSDFIDGASQVSGSCALVDQQKSKFTCVWLSGPVENAVNGEITVSATDGQNNFLSETVAVKTYLALDESRPDYFTHTVSCSPKALDRELGPLAEQRSYCTITLVPQDAANPISVELAGCTGDQSSLLARSELFHNQVGLLSPLLKLTTRKNDFKLDDLKTACTLLIHSQVGPAVTKVPEEEIVNIQLLFYNNPLGELSSGVQDKVDEAIENTQGIWDLIGTLKTLVEFLRKICSFLAFVYGIIELMAFVTIALKGSAAGCTATIIGNLGICQSIEAAGGTACSNQQVAEQVKETAPKGQKSFLQKGLDACQYVSCEKSWPNLESLQTADGKSMKQVVEGWVDELPGISGLGSISSDFKAANLIRPERSLIWSVIPPPCIPGIIDKLDEYRQIQCLYADCLQTAVLEDNVPVKICEDLKAEATCKYVMGEFFALVPYTAALDRLAGMAKQLLSDPLILLGVAVRLGAQCTSTCWLPSATGGLSAYTTCEVINLVSKIGGIIQQVTAVFDGGLFTSQEDYCDRLNTGETGEGGFLGIF